MAEFKIGGYTYRNAPMSAMTQFHVASKLLPVLTSINNFQSLFALQSGADGVSNEERAGKVIEALRPVAVAVSGMKPEESEYIFRTCLGTCSRCDGDATVGSSWAPIWPHGASQPMFRDITMLQMIEITFNVISDNLGNFSPALPVASTGQVAK